MPNTTQDSLYETFLALAANLGQMPNPITEASQELAQSADSVSKAMESVRVAWDQVRPLAVGPTASAGTKASTTVSTGDSMAATILNAAVGTIPVAGGLLSSSDSDSSGSSTIERVMSTVFKSGLGLIPLVGGLLGLFGGGDSETTTPLLKYAMPSALRFQAGQTEWGLGSSDYDQAGVPRVYGLEEWSESASPGQSPGNATSSSARQPAQITVNVNAMDARSFLDRSSDIAAAVRDAMLNLNPINDVVNDL